ncbi:hypothetical protein GCM10010116_51900 [Microbispora rosea subsp. aerata]|nr:hypothetical protein [Microbispora rosea]GGO25860.1 hypothetical protein GCM10010116_51900 [Microbispora rosea subsp. aerata]GIH56933.1 hypothetical protein Mro02_38470 [Microbispora rosea subsp. aerata]GLJ82859.1 hypothetical protein GCM10017588_15850 [Microbispora rosea subsp. aerata]
MGETRTWPAVAVASAITLVCAIVGGLAASAAVAELTRGPSVAELREAQAAETALRWQRWPAGRIFPAGLAYTSEQGGRESARRVGISSRTDCRGAVDTAIAAKLKAAGCRAVLRATYLDALQGIVVTIGVAAFPDERAARSAVPIFPRDGSATPGLRALAFPGTVTERFTASGRQSMTLRQAGPYLVMTTAGQVDGRPARALGEQRETMFAFTGDLAEAVGKILTAPASPDCTAKEWQC